MSGRVLRVLRLGRVSYLEAMRVQKILVDRLKSRPGLDWTLILCEHDPVYTVGLRTDPYPDQDLDQLRTKTQAQVLKTDRGGLITFHGPGQLVCYPIVHLGALQQGVRWYVSRLEKAVVEVCDSFGIRAMTSPHTGVWVGDRKVCAIGIRVSRRVTTHGLALNCDLDLSWFSHIVPCGLRGLGVTSLSLETGAPVRPRDAEGPLLRALGDAFNSEVLDLDRGQD